jgi:DNA polymerase III subunit epsilon
LGTFLILLIIGVGIYLFLKLQSQGNQTSNIQTQQTSTEFRNLIDELLDDRCVILDTETTGLNNTAEIVEISLIDSQGNVLLDTLVKPKRKMRSDNKAVAIHGITNEMLENAPKWDAIHDTFCNLIKGKRVVIYNAKYDVRLLEQTADKYGLTIPEFEPECVMMIYGAWEGTKNQYDAGYKWHKLDDAVRTLGVKVQGKPHRALTDCLMTLGVLQQLRNTPPRFR